VKAFWRALVSFFGWLANAFARRPTRRGPERDRAFPTRRYVVIAACDEITPDPPPMHWAPCHPSVRGRYKASMACPQGHGLTLGNHAIAANGAVFPSVVCPSHGCDFHEFVRLDRWTFGALA
jgi:hypothetical protein